jgi:predicted transcriptional regulator
MSITSIRLNAEIEAPLDELAKKLSRSKNYLINQAIKEYVWRQSMEDARWIDTEQALGSVNKGNTIREKAVKSWLESWGKVNEKDPPGA